MVLSSPIISNPIGGVGVYPRNNEWCTTGSPQSTGSSYSGTFIVPFFLPIDLYISDLGLYPTAGGGTDAMVGIYEYDYINGSVINKLKGTRLVNLVSVFRSAALGLNLPAGWYHFVVMLQAATTLRDCLDQYCARLSFGSGSPPQTFPLNFFTSSLGFSDPMPESIDMSLVTEKYTQRYPAVFWKGNLYGG